MNRSPYDVYGVGGDQSLSWDSGIGSVSAAAGLNSSLELTEPSLRFRRSGQDGGTHEDIAVAIQRSKVVDCVAHLGEKYADARFEPLAKALEILGSINAEEELESLRDEWREVDLLVDGVVDLHHVGFNKSLQDYSKILTLLSDAEHSMHIIRKNLLLAQDTIRVDTSHLLESYHKYAVIVETIKLIESLQWVCEAIESVDCFEKDADWNACVKMLLQASNTLAREEINSLSAVKPLIIQVRGKAHTLIDVIIQEAQKQAYSGRASFGSHGSEKSLMQRKAALRQRNSRLSKVGSGFFSAPNSMSTSAVARTLKFHSLVEDAHIFSASNARKLSDTLHGVEGHVVDTRFGVNPSYVSCIAQLGGVSKALRSIRAVTRQKLRDTLVQTVCSRMNSLNSQVDASKRAENIVGSLLAKSETIFKAVCSFVRQLSISKISAPSSGLTLLQGHCADDDKDIFPDGESGVSVALRECSTIWENVQYELLHVVSSVLGLSIQPRKEFDSEGHFSSIYWSNVSSSVPMNGELSMDSIKRTNSVDFENTLKFSMEEQLGAGKVGTLAKSDGFSSFDLEHFIKTAMGEQNCSITSAAALYAPIKKFVSKCCKYLDDLKAEKKKNEVGPKRGKVGSPISPGILNTFSFKSGGSSKRGFEDNNEILLLYIVDILRTDFVPTVYAECGHRTQGIIANMAFSSKSHAEIFAIAEKTVQLIRDLLSWSSMASVVAPNITGVLENSLGKLVESLLSHAVTLSKNSIAIKMAQDADMIHIMAQEPISMLLGGPEWFAVDSASPGDSLLTSAVASRFALGKNVLPKQMIKNILALRPLDKSSLILQSNVDMKSIVSLALIAQSAELIANGIVETVAIFSQKPQSSTQPSMDRFTSVERKGIDGRLATGLVHIADRYRAASGFCIRALRIEASLHILYSVQDIANISTPDEINTFEARIALMAPKLASMDEVLGSHLSPPQREYILASLPGVCNKLTIWMMRESSLPRKDLCLPVVRALSSVQPVICSLGVNQQTPSNPFLKAVSGHEPIQNAKLYYKISSQSMEEIILAAENGDIRPKFTSDEWLVLLDKPASVKHSSSVSVEEAKQKMRALLKL